MKIPPAGLLPPAASEEYLPHAGGCYIYLRPAAAPSGMLPRSRPLAVRYVRTAPTGSCHDSGITLPCSTPCCVPVKVLSAVGPWPLLPRALLIAAPGTPRWVSFRSLVYCASIKQDNAPPAAAARRITSALAPQLAFAIPVAGARKAPRPDAGPRGGWPRLLPIGNICGPRLHREHSRNFYYAASRPGAVN